LPKHYAPIDEAPVMTETEELLEHEL
jgi:hypothetical protein